MIATSIDNLGDAVEVLAGHARPGWSYSITTARLTPTARPSESRPSSVGRLGDHRHTCRTDRTRQGAAGLPVIDSADALA